MRTTYGYSRGIRETSKHKKNAENTKCEQIATYCVSSNFSSSTNILSPLDFDSSACSSSCFFSECLQEESPLKTCVTSLTKNKESIMSGKNQEGVQVASFSKSNSLASYENFEKGNNFYRKKRKLDLKGINKIRSVNEIYRDCFEILACDLRLSIFTYIMPVEIRTNLMYVNKKWCAVLSSSALWSRLVEIHGLFSAVYVNSKPISERRSKGKIRHGHIIGCRHPVCVRTIHLETTNAGKDDGVPTSFLRESALLQHIEHPNVVKFYSAEVVDEKLRVITEYLPFNLKQFWQELRLRGLLARIKVVRRIVRNILQQLLQGLNYLHHHGIFHRNLKPENIFIDERIDSKTGQTVYIVKIGDFCMSRICDAAAGQYTPEDPKDRERSWREARRLYYRAPEMIMRKLTYGLEVDMWSLGIILMEMVLCKPPLFADNEISYLFEVFRLIGTPSEDVLTTVCDTVSIWVDTFPKWQPVRWHEIQYLFKNKYFRGSPEYAEIAMKHQLTGQSEPFEILIDFTRVMGVEVLELLKRFLTIPGHQRISAAEALEYNKIFKSNLYNHNQTNFFFHDSIAENTREKLIPAERMLDGKEKIYVVSKENIINRKTEAYQKNLYVEETRNVTNEGGMLEESSMSSCNVDNYNRMKQWFHPSARDFNPVQRIKRIEIHIGRQVGIWSSSASAYVKNELCNVVEQISIINLRAEIVNWLFKMQPEFLLKSQTIHLAVEYFHRYMSVVYFDLAKIPTLEEMKLAALTSLKIADVYNERSQEYYKSDNANEYSDLTGIEVELEEGVVDVVNRQISAEQILEQEKKMLNILKFNLLTPTILWFLEAYMQLADIDKNLRCVDFAYMIADLCLYDDILRVYTPVLIAQVILIFSVCTYHLENNGKSYNFFQNALNVSDNRSRYFTEDIAEGSSMQTISNAYSTCSSYSFFMKNSLESKNKALLDFSSNTEYDQSCRTNSEVKAVANHDKNEKKNAFTQSASHSYVCEPLVRRNLEETEKNHDGFSPMVFSSQQFDGELIVDFLSSSKIFNSNSSNNSNNDSSIFFSNDSTLRCGCSNADDLKRNRFSTAKASKETVEKTHSNSNAHGINDYKKDNQIINKEQRETVYAESVESEEISNMISVLPDLSSTKMEETACNNLKPEWKNGNKKIEFFQSLPAREENKMCCGGFHHIGGNNNHAEGKNFNTHDTNNNNDHTAVTCNGSHHNAVGNAVSNDNFSSYSRRQLASNSNLNAFANDYHHHQSQKNLTIMNEQKTMQKYSKNESRKKSFYEIAIESMLGGFIQHRDILCEHNTVWMSANCLRRIELLTNKGRHIMQMNCELNAALNNHSAEGRFTVSTPKLPLHLLHYILPYEQRLKLHTYGCSGVSHELWAKNYSGFLDCLLDNKFST